MKDKLLRLFAALLMIACICGNYKTYGLAFTTWEEAREWFKENGVPASGGTHLELSECPGEDVPHSKASSSTTNTALDENKKIETPKQSAHEHTYIETVTKEPTCIEEGEKTFTCSCGYKYTEPIEMIAHDYSKEINTQEATCTVSGKKIISCSVCNDTYEEEITPLGHEKGVWVTSKAATCTEKGEEIVSCKKCGEMIDSREIEALEHTEGEWVITKQATLFREGLKELKCATCEEVLDTEIIPINMKTWYIIIGVASAIAVTTVIVHFVRKKKILTILSGKERLFS